jgi:hypothetical protein
MGDQPEVRSRTSALAGARRGACADAALVVSLVVLTAAGCGGGSQRKSTLRPPSGINVSVRIGQDGVTVSPARFGAGPIKLLASNQSTAAQRLTLDGPRVRRSVGPIPPAETGSMTVTVQPGAYSLSADGSGGLKPAKLTVGPKRPSAQNQLLLP